ncbi:MAG TPA: pitrilysin family protein [Thermoanaerobaculia bacterium]
MKFSRRLVVIALAGTLAVPALAQQVPVVEKTLGNGMRLLMVRRTGEPTVAGGWVAHVGSANERPGITGISHFFEHMMFKGTPALGTKDAVKDKEIIAEQEKIADAIRKEEATMRVAYLRGEIGDPMKRENWTPRRTELDAQMDKLIAAQRAILVKNEFDRIYTNGGASGMNAFTNYDMTGYFITVPSNKLELWMWMESDRLLRPVFREFYAERDVVFEERRLRTESTPLGKFEEQLESMFWEASTYGWPVVGWPSDLVSYSLAQANDYYATYYQPANITLILVGDFDAAATERMVTKYFGRIPAGKKPVPPVVTMEVPQQAEKRMIAAADTNPQADILWRTVPFRHKDSYALQVLSQILSTRTGRLYKNLVLGSGVATEAFARQESRKYAGLFNAGGEAKDGRKPEEVEKAIYAELEKLQKDEVPAEELQKVKNNFAAAEYRRLSANFPILVQLIFNEGLGDWKEFNESGKKIQAVTAADVQRVATTYFTPENRTVAIYTRKAGAAPAAEDPDLAGLNDQQKQMVRQLSQQLATVNDPEQLRQMLQRFDAQAGSAPAEMKPAMDAARKKIEARLAALEKAKAGK